MSLYFLLNTKQENVKNVGNQTVSGNYWFIYVILWKSIAMSNCVVKHNIRNKHSTKRSVYVHENTSLPKNENYLMIYPQDILQ